MRHHLSLAFFLSALLSTPVLAETSTILVPTLYAGPGAFGSTWWSAVVVNNHAAAPFSSPGVQFFIECVIPEGCQSDFVPAGAFGAVSAPTPVNGLLLHGDPSTVSALAFHGRFGQGGDYLTNGTELPIVRDSQFSQTTIHFPYVTLYDTPQPVRSTLRIYGLNALPGTAVRVEVRPWSNPSGTPQATETVQLGVQPSSTDVPIFPAFAQVSLNNDFPFQQLLGSIFNIAVVPLPLPSGDIPKIWAFITTTQNDTQQVLVQTPQ